MKGHPSELQLEKALIATKTQYHKKKKKKRCYSVLIIQNQTKIEWLI